MSTVFRCQPSKARSRAVVGTSESHFVSLRGVLVGCGYTSSYQLAAWSRIPQVNIVGVADREPPLAQRRAVEFGIPDVYPDLVTMLEDTAPDFVDIATRPDSHFELVAIAARHGVDILCQKPAAETLGELREMINVCREANVRLIINENARFQPWYRRIHQLIHDDHLLGEVVSLDMESHAEVTVPKAGLGSQPFFAEMSRLILFELGVHHLDTARYLLGEASSISATTHKVSSTIAGEDEAVSISVHDGVTATIDMSWARPPHLRGAKTKATWAAMQIEGSEATLRLGYDGALTVDGTALGPQDWANIDGKQRGYEQMQRHFVDCLVGGTEAETSASETLKTMELVFGAYLSAETGRPYRVSTDIDQLA